MNKNYFRAIATMVGTIIGVGMFAIPYVINKSGIISLLVYMPVLGAAQYYLHKLYAEIVLSHSKESRLPGFASKYAGLKGKTITLLIITLGNYGSLLAYIIVGGIFLQELLGPVFGRNLFAYTLILFLARAAIVWFGFKVIANVEFFMSGLLIVAVGLIAWKGCYFIDPGNYTLLDLKNIFLPYGPIFFAVGGGAAIPDICKLLGNQKEKIRDALWWGSFISIAIMMIFTVVVLGIAGNKITPDTLVGLHTVIDNGVIKLALIFGLLSITTSFITVAQATREIYEWDYKISKNFSWLLACFIPFAMYLFGVQNLTQIVSISGAITGGLAGIIIIWLAVIVKKKRRRKPVMNSYLSQSLALVLSSLFMLGLVYELAVINL